MILALRAILFFLASNGVRALNVVNQHSCNDLHGCRTTLGIIWSCLATMFACSWVTIHPNIPGPDDSPLAIALVRMKLMVYSLVAPEIIVMWAMRQWIVARRQAELRRERGWNLSRAFFVMMGGFLLFDSNGPLTPLIPSNLDEGCYEEPGSTDIERKRVVHFDLPRITSKEIWDKSKGDTISKGLVIGQTGWFVLQCTARTAQHLPITELELVTLAIAALNLVTYAFWWHKPLNVKCPIPVAERISGTANVDMGDGGISNGRLETEVVSVQDEPNEASNTAKATIVHAMGKASNTLHGLFKDFHTMGTSARIAYDWQAEKKVPMFYAGEETEGDLTWVMYFGALLAFTFGAIHCIAWSFFFPSRAEQLLWRISSITILSLPAALLLSHHPYCIRIRRPVHMMIVVPYIIARTSLVVEAFLSLRSIPPGAYQVVQWTTFIPHV